MNVLFLIPPAELNLRGIPIDRVYGCNYGFDYKPPIHFLQVASYAKQELGWNIRFMDCPAESITLSNFLKFKDWDYDVVCFWSTYLSAIEDTRAGKHILKSFPDIKLVYMGTAPTWKPEEFHLSKNTFVLLGEMELTLRDLDKAWKTEHYEDIPGLGYFDNKGSFKRGAFRQLLDVPSLPMADRSLLKGNYRANRLSNGPITVMAVSRGCGFRCTFCTTNAIDQAVDLEFKRQNPAFVDRPPLRKRSPEQVIAEFEDIAAKGYKSVEIADNIFTWGRSRTLQICKGIEHLGLEWICLARANMLHDPEVIKAMVRAGCKLVYMGSESFDDGLLDDMVKEIHVKDIIAAVQTCKDNGLEPEVSVLIGGSPHESWKTLLNSWWTARKLGTDFVHYSVVLPSPSTAMYDDAIKNGWFIDGDFRPIDNAREVIVNLPNLSAKELQLAIKLAYGLQYLSPSGIWKQVKKVRNVRDIRHKASAAKQLLGFLTDSEKVRTTTHIPAGRVTPSHA
jgi:anaerobic magnesium-protoporphyrin IX monomethyl ester cyclase